MERAARVPVCGLLLRIRYTVIGSLRSCAERVDVPAVRRVSVRIRWTCGPTPCGSQSGGGGRAWKEIVGILIVFIRTGDEREPELGMARVSPR